MFARSFDAIVVGAGPAGSTLALRLARAGHHVALLDRRRFPRPKPCGEFLSPACLPILEDLGARGAMLDLGARRVTGMRLHGYGHASTGHYRDVGRSFTFDHGYAIRREVMDHELLKLAVAAGDVELFEGCCVRRLIRAAGGPVLGVHASSAEHGVLELRAPWTAGADGVRSCVAQSLGVLRRMRWLDKLAVTTHYRGVAALATAEVHLFSGGYFAAAPVDAGLFSLNLVLDRARLRRNGESWDDVFDRYLLQAPELRRRMAGAERAGQVRGIGPLAYRTTAQVTEGCALVGDACGYVDPLTGEGIYFALRGAEALAQDLDRAIMRRSAQRRDLRGYAAVRRRELAPRMWMSKLLQRGLRSGFVTNRVLEILERSSGAMDLLVSITGDYVGFRELLRPRVWRRALAAPGRG